MKRQTQIFSLVIFFLLFLVYSPWFLHKLIIGGDWPFFFQESVNSFSFFPSSWNYAQNNGLGGQSITYALDSYLYFTGWFFSVLLHIPWLIVYKIVWFGVFVVLSVCSGIFLFKTVFPKSILWQQLLAAFLYATNTYILLVAGGGQMGVALGYAMAPLVLIAFIKVSTVFNLDFINLKTQNIKIQTTSQRLKLSIIAGLVFAVQVMFDFRIAYITMSVIVLYLLFYILYIEARKTIHATFYLLLYTLVIPLGITIFLHAFWLLPIILTKYNPTSSLGSAYTSLSSVKYFSFATFENALGLLHPYWPENIFGKVGFMKPEYLLLPLLAFSGLLFIATKAQKKTEHYTDQLIVLFFALLGLIGIFLAKGANDPFGGVYLWMFVHIPGFVIFRDPTKFYLLIVLSYTVLLPFSLWKISEKVSSSKYKVLGNYSAIVVIFIFIVFWLFTINQAVFGQMNGTFARKDVPIDYVILKNKLVTDNTFYRTLWVPQEQRFVFTSNVHPAIEANPYFSATDAASLQQKLSAKNTENYLSDLGVKYILIPDDVYGEIFLENRKYNQKKRDEYEKVLDKISWLKKVQKGKLTIYETKSHEDLFWTTSNRAVVSYKMISPTQYMVSINNVKKGDKLFFAASYNPGWIVECCGVEKMNSQRLVINTINSINSFVLPQDGNYSVDIYYLPEEYYITGRIVSFISLIFLVGLLLFLKVRKSKL